MHDEKVLNSSETSKIMSKENQKERPPSAKSMVLASDDQADKAEVSDKLPVEDHQTALRKTLIYLGLVATILAIILSLLDIPVKWSNAKEVLREPPTLSQETSLEQPQLMPQVLTGEIRDAETNVLLPDVEVLIPEHEQRQTTNEFGRYRFELMVPKNSRVTLQAKRKGYESIEQDPVIGGNDTWVMRRLE